MARYRHCVEYKEVFSTALGKKVRRCAKYAPLATATARLKEVA